MPVKKRRKKKRKPPKVVTFPLTELQGQYLQGLQGYLKDKVGAKITYTEILQGLLDMMISGSTWFEKHQAHSDAIKAGLLRSRLKKERENESLRREGESVLPEKTEEGGD